jgi:protein O-GlcNAc transferase
MMDPLEPLRRLIQKRDFADGLALAETILATHPDLPEGWYLRGLAELELKQPEKAEASFQKALTLAPDVSELHTQLGHAVRLQERMEEALSYYRMAAEAEANSPSAHNNVGATLQALGRWAEAIEAYQRAIALQPNDPTYYNNLGLMYCEMEQFAAAVEAHQQALELKPDYYEAIYNQANAFLRANEYAAAVDRYEHFLRIAPDKADAYFNYAIALKKSKNYRGSLGACEERYRLAPDVGNSASALLMALQPFCDWSRNEILSRQVIASIEADCSDDIKSPIAPFAFLGLPIPTTPTHHLRCAEKWATKVQKVANKLTLDVPLRQVRRRPPRLKIGYLSEDFITHPVAYAVVELFESHDRDRFEVVGYSYGPDDQSGIRQRIIRAFDDFHDLQPRTLGEAILKIADDEVDILVDLQGYTGESRSEILARRPAPIQVNFLGYPGSMGADFIDYIIVDNFVVPPSQQPFFREKLVPIEGCYLVGDSQYEIAKKCMSRHEAKLPDDAIVLGCFNNSYKITPMMFDAWMRILKRVPKAVLWLRDWGDTTKINLRCEATARDVDADRLIFAPLVSMSDHAARHRLVDLFLDTFPYNAHATASLSLRMGIPTVTLAGDTFPSRVAGSLLHSIGFDELITYSLADYEEKICELAMEPLKLQSLRERIATAVIDHPTFNGRDFARKLEVAFESMWNVYERQV